MALVYVNLETDALVDVDIQTTFMRRHFSLNRCVEYMDGGLGVRDGHLIIPIVKNRVHGIFPKLRRYATCDRHKPGSISLNTSFVGYGPNSALLLDEVRIWTPSNHRIAPDALFTLEQCRAYLEELERKAFVEHGIHGGGIQILWNEHGMEGTSEGYLHRDLSESRYSYVQIKGLDPTCDSYSGLLDNLGRPVGLGERLKKDGVKRVFITGLASDFCVKWTAINAIREYGFTEVFVILDATRPVDLPGTDTVAGSMTKAMYEMVAAGIQFITADQLRLVIDPR